ncbi:MAG: glycosyltransferase [Candidatus Heimdallarchaeota archaeon]|nr:glycosyltransferase [Candidatus Heimdallarchaeota archaeon]
MEVVNLTVIIPTLNEEENIGRLCETIRLLIPQILIIVVDDGSTDNTRELARHSGDYVTVIDRSNREIVGLTASIKEGIENCKTEYFMTIDGDFQHPPESLLDAIKCLLDDPDVIIGFRIKVEDWPFTRKLMSFTAQFLAHFSLRLRHRQIPKDVMSGFFGGKVEVFLPLLENNVLALKGYKLLFDILKILPRRTKIKQFGYVFKNREFGDSKIGKTQIWEFFKSVF